MNTRFTSLCFALAALLIGSLVAQAADLPQPSYKAPAYVGPSYANWTGFYLGINGGYGFGKSDWDFPVAGSIKADGAMVGATAGYNFQTGLWVWGLEGDWDYTWIKGDLTPCLGGTCEAKVPWLATARGRIGYAGWNNWLPYITGGAAFGQIKPSSPLGGSSHTETGWTVGAGVEYAMWTNWSVKLEYLYVDLGKFDCSIPCGVVGDNATAKAQLIRLGVNYRF